MRYGRNSISTVTGAALLLLATAAHDAGAQRGRLGRLDRQARDEARASVRRELGPDLAAVQLDDLAADVQPQP
jgi:hypothetical protein